MLMSEKSSSFAIAKCECVLILTDCMIIDFKNTKELKCYKEFVEHPTDRKALRAFLKYFPKEITSDCVRRHELMKQYDTALEYNRVYGSTTNRIEKKDGAKQSNPLVLKVRVSGSWRKFFYVVCNNGDYLLARDWIGQFEDAKSIYIIDVNKHDYNIE